MRQTLLAIACLGTFAMAQNVLAIAPAAISNKDDATDLIGASMKAATAAPPPFVAARRHADAAPPVSSTALLLAGLAGLTVAGGRRERIPGETT